MAAKPMPLDHWRGFFRAANCDIFHIIDRAIAVAASDCPQEFPLRRDRIAERLFTSRLARCSGCDRVELSALTEEAEEKGGDRRGARLSGSDSAGKSGSKESKVNSSSRDGDDHHREQRGELFVSNCSYDEAEALTDEIEEESKVVGEVLRIKQILLNSKEESESVLYGSLRRLQLMALSVGTLKETEIGKAVNPLRKHGSEDISHLACALISAWKAVVDEYYKAVSAIPEPESTPDSVMKNTPSINHEEEEEEEEEEGLPSPPMDEGALFATQTGPVELSGFFDGMDDDGNPRSGGEFIKNRDNTDRRQSLDKPKLQKPVSSVRGGRGPQIKSRESVLKPSRPINAKPMGSEQRVDREAKLQPKRREAAPVQKRQFGDQQDEMRCSNEVSVQMKLEATKRKLQESYQQAETAKKQRKIQVMDLHDIPKQKSGPKNFFLRPGMQNKHWANGRR